MQYIFSKRSLLALFFSVAFFLTNSFTYAQKKTVTYFDSKRQKTKKKDAFIIRTVEANPDSSTLLIFKEHFNNGQIYREGFVTSIKPLEFEGPLVTYRKDGSKISEKYYKECRLFGKANYYYKNGQLKEQLNYLESPKDAKYIPLEERTEMIYYYDSLGNTLVNNGNGLFREGNDSLYTEGEYKNKLRSGIWKGTFHTYNPKRIVSYVEEYENGKLISGVTTDVDGEESPYTVKRIQPEYPEGMKALYKFITESFIYPPEAVENRVNGRLLIQFVVGHKGEITRTRVVESIGFGCDAEGLRIVNNMKKWKPGFIRGMPVSVVYTLPIQINIASKSNRRPTF